MAEATSASLEEAIAANANGEVDEHLAMDADLSATMHITM
jgi:hypothetical protein